MAILSRLSSGLKEEVVVPGRIIDAFGSNVRVVSVHGGPYPLAGGMSLIWEVGISRNLWNIPSLTCAYLSAVYSALHRACLTLWTPSA